MQQLTDYGRLYSTLKTNKEESQVREISQNVWAPNVPVKCLDLTSSDLVRLHWIYTKNVLTKFTKAFPTKFSSSFATLKTTKATLRMQINHKFIVSEAPKKFLATPRTNNLQCADPHYQSMTQRKLFDVGGGSLRLCPSIDL